MKRKLIILCMIMLLSLACSFTTFAQEIDQSKTGSITVTLTEKYENKPIAGVEFCVYYVATVGVNTDGNLNYIYTDAFDCPNVSIDDSDLVAHLDAYVEQHDIEGTRLATDAGGVATCQNLELGLYFVKQTNVVEGFLSCEPFLVTVPFENAGEYIYDVDASPKTEVVKLIPITIKKVWNTNAATKASDYVTVQLWRENTLIETAILNEQNNWQITYSDMPQSDAYSVKEVDIPKGFTAIYSQEGYVFTVTNMSTLIQTGQLIWPIPVLAISGLLLIVIGMGLLQQKRKRYE